LEVVAVTPEDRTQLDDQQRAKLSLDYQQTTQYIQLLTNIRFLPITLLPGITGVAVTLLTKSDSPSLGTFLVVGLMGLFTSVGIILYDVHNTALHDAAVHRAKWIERALRLPPSIKKKEAGGLYNERPEHIDLNPDPRLAKRPLAVRQSRFVALIFGAVIGGWVNIIAYASLQLLPASWQASEGANYLVSTLLAVVVAALIVWKGPQIQERNKPELQDEQGGM
jgi:hypothetical protein